MKEVEESKKGTDNSQEEETHLKADEGELLVHRRILHTYESSLDMEQREVISHS